MINLEEKPIKRSDYKYFHAITTRWSDNDIYGHVNNIVYYSYFDTAANQYLIDHAELDIQNAQNSCDDCVKMILVAFIAAYANFNERIAGTNLEDYTLHMIEITAPKTEMSCGS